MKKILLILVCFLSVLLLIMSCGDDPNDGGDSCSSNFDCPIGKVCSGGFCVSEGSGDNGSGGNGNGNGELPDGGSNDGGDTSHGDTDSSDPSDTESDTEHSDTEHSDTSDSTSDTDHGDSQGGGDTVADTDNGDSSDSGSGDTTSDTQADTGFDPSCEDSCVPMEPDCLPAMDSEAASGLCNGLDDDCDGKVDEGCPCKAGETQACFSGPRNFRKVGTCADGVQTCIVQMRAGQGDWGKSQCVGQILPSQDVCDNADNKCNGCADHNLCCTPPIDCAYKLDVDAAGNPDPFLPFKYKIIDGKQIYRKYDDADTATWEWTLSKGPCDIVLNKVNSFVKGGKTLEEVGDINTDNGVQNTVVSGVGMSQFKVKFRLSGSYNLHLKVTRENGEVYECEWIIRVVSNGLRVELCWDRTGSVDIDLHMGKNGVTKAGTNSDGCDSTTYPGWGSDTACFYHSMKPNWGYATTANYDKDGNWQTSMNNPRLDIDNISTVGIPENINIDNPVNNDTFRVLVRHFSATQSTETHPVVNIYCGGTRKATYGTAESGTQLSGFKNQDDSWKVVEIKWKGAADSDECELTPNLNVSVGAVPSDYDNDW